ncbi:Glycosyltransferase involved in cell wall bisynthesis [Salinimicrobium catena]|uniref:Glycosyltransferase involved in cell wall bisynthesis n=2 Tax=Salinimicrobium catena TaxID=390640 RepID=A0A1H5N9X9_9FLAO|nr:Glycosyltransferase involved in cell wall bisynthesis [Salinimicrobium catena]SEE98365.1 Glycosyltransferase involved in cell wall bisynthesis [Salinimicrobium catena]
MRVLQLIDTLRSGGAEQMAVSYANALAKEIDGSFLCCTRKEGLLKKRLSGDVGYLYLNRKHSLDLPALWKLRKFVKQNRIGLVQAHGTSWFLAVMLKLSLPGIKVVWHDHYGKDLKQRKAGLLRSFSSLFDGVITVNSDLRNWVLQELQVKQVRYFRNFLPEEAIVSRLELKGEADDFRIICVANFRPQKDHLNLLRAFETLLKDNKHLSLHLVGKVLEDSYSKSIEHFIQENELRPKVFVYGEQEDVADLLRQADLGVLSSASEGLPVALLEYARAGLPVVATRVGEIPKVVGEDAVLVPPGDPEALATAIRSYMQDSEKRLHDSARLKKTVMEQYSREGVLPEVIGFFSEILLENSEQ